MNPTRIVLAASLSAVAAASARADCRAPREAPDGAAVLATACETLLAAGVDPERYLAVSPEGRAALQGNFMYRALPDFERARAALEGAGIDLSGLDVRDRLVPPERAEVAQEAKGILREIGADGAAEEGIRICEDGSVRIDSYNSAVTAAMQAAEGVLRLRRFRPAPPPPCGCDRDGR